MKESDLLLVLEWRNSERIRSVMYTDHEILWEDHAAWFQRSREDRSAVHLVFEFAGEPAGVVNFTNIQPVHSTAYWGFYLGRQDLPRGTGYRMGKLAINYAFDNLRLRKLCGEVFAFNIPSVNYHEKLGFRREGILRNHYWKNHAYQDVICFALFQDDYLQGSACHE